MKLRALLTSVTAVAMLAGCGAQKQYNTQLAGAQDALVAEFPELAAERLDKADQIAARHSLPHSPQARLLEAQALLQMDEVAGARALAGSIARENVPGTVLRAQAEEILAKVEIRRGNFEQALDHLASADRSYDRADDRARVADLSYLTKGLSAYGRGKTLVAHEHWQKIADLRLRASVSHKVQTN